MHGGNNPGAPKGNQRAFKHGRKSAAHLQAMAMIRAFQREALGALEWLCRDIAHNRALSGKRPASLWGDWRGETVERHA